MKAKEIFQYSLAGLIMLGYIVLIGVAMFVKIPTDNKETVSTLLVTYTVIVVLVSKFFYDGNKETATRNEMLYRSTPPTS